MLARLSQTCRVASLARPFSSSSRSLFNLNDDLQSLVSEQVKVQERQAAAAPVSQPKPVEWDRFEYAKVLAPKHLTYKYRLKEQKRWKKRAIPTSREARPTDVFHQLNLDPRDFSTTSNLLYTFVTEMGKIQGRDATNLTARSQRLLGKTIRRAKHMGIMSNLSRPPNFGRPL
ncbi:hypothetical protein CPB83DRAFT_901743 [Crepidotus variabilis]|uniref:Small ribosomal subunit protein bS18m n=1 Tax=Crepidotus variabilis TaxID=179855 RepID=A0A9P6ETT4_9AGAR|nr:hypothetical protein CPB83DRAFT_901743 [Crepidotus variabilis]